MLGIVTEALDEGQAVQLVAELEASAFSPEGKGVRFEQQDGSLGALGYVLAQTRTGLPSWLPHRWSSLCLPSVLGLPG